MIAVDLVPEELKADKLRRKRLRVWLLAVIATTIAVFVWAAMDYLTLRREDQTMQQLAEQSQDIENSIAELNRTKEQLELWQDRIAVTDKLGSYPDYIAITSYLSENSPKLIYLKEMKFARQDASTPSRPQLPKPPTESMAKGASMFLLKDSQAPQDSDNTAGADNTKPVLMTLTGHSLDYQTVADYINVLRDSEVFYDVKLKSTKRRQEDDSNTVNFEIQSILTPRRSSMGVNYADLQQTKNL